jgi:hypothetical protein
MVLTVPSLFFCVMLDVGYFLAGFCARMSGVRIMNARQTELELTSVALTMDMPSPFFETIIQHPIR